MAKPELTVSDAAQLAFDTLRSARVHLGRVRLDPSLGGGDDPRTVALDVRRGWGIDATLHVRVTPRRGKTPSSVDVTVNASTTTRSISQTLGFAALLHELAVLGATVEGVLTGGDGFDIVPDPEEPLPKARQPVVGAGTSKIGSARRRRDAGSES